VSILFSRARKLDATGQIDDFWMLVDGDTIVATGTGTGTGTFPAADSIVDVAGAWLTPGFIDLHSHGGGGVEYPGGLPNAEGNAAIESALAAHRAHGTTRSILSLVAAPLHELEASLRIIAELVEQDSGVLGSHLEGPYLSPIRAGAHRPEFLREPQPAELDELLNAARGTLRQMTLAPELPNAFELINLLVENDVVVAVGHTEADFELTKRAFDSGARLLTHAFNAMPGISARAPGPVVAAFEDRRVTIELILDGEHVHPDIAALAFRSAPGRVALVTDAIAAAGFRDDDGNGGDGHGNVDGDGNGDYVLGSMPVEVRDGVAHLAGTETLAGSTLTQDRALRLAIERVGIAPAHAVGALTHVPARVLGLEHRHGLLAPGYVADAVLLDATWNVEGVWASGRRVS
jgi:N-acetylglucosamine-6-phosphate deacetylase